MTVLATDTPVQIAAAIVAAISKKTDLPVTAAVKSDATDTVELTAKMLGFWVMALIFALTISVRRGVRLHRLA